jgi:hypothetical protein
MTGGSQNGPVLFCFDGSDGSREALRAAADLINRPVDVVVLTVWETVATRLALAGAFAVGNTPSSRSETFRACTEISTSVDAARRSSGGQGPKASSEGRRTPMARRFGGGC